MKISASIKSREVDLVLLLVAFFWGSSYLSAKVLTQHTSVLSVLGLRFCLTSVGMALIWLIRRESFQKPEWILGSVLGMTQALILFCETSGVSKTTATNAGLIISLTIVMTPILESIASKNWLPRGFFIAAVVAVVGVALLVSGEGFSVPGLGDWLMLIAALIRSIHVTAMGHLTRGKSYSTVNITMVQTLTCGVIFTLLSFKTMAEAVSTFAAAQWYGLLYLSLLCGLFSFLANLWAIRRTSASRAGLLLATEPIWAVVVGITIGGETLAALGVVGALLILGATFWGQRIETKHRARKLSVNL
jgi:drug/metabolite transporter (DMT)-like permease